MLARACMSSIKLESCFSSPNDAYMEPQCAKRKRTRMLLLYQNLVHEKVAKLELRRSPRRNERRLPKVPLVQGGLRLKKSKNKIKMGKARPKINLDQSPCVRLLIAR